MIRNAESLQREIMCRFPTCPRRLGTTWGRSSSVCQTVCMQHLDTIINGLVVLLVGWILWIVADIRNDIRHLHTRIDNVLLSRSAEARE